MINHDRNRGQRVSEPFPFSSVLSLPKVEKSDSGNYTCSPESAEPDSVLIHVLDEGSNSVAAIQEDDGGEASAASAVASSSSSQSVVPAQRIFPAIVVVVVATVSMGPRRLLLLLLP